MGFKDVLKDAFGLRKEDEEYYEDEQGYDDMITRELPQNTDDAFPYAVEGGAKKNKVVNIHATTQLSVVLVKPERFDNAREIADHLNNKRTVVLNLESTNKETSRRLVDFLCGVAYANNGKIQRIANSTFIITPYNVDMEGELLDELENNGIFF